MVKGRIAWSDEEEAAIKDGVSKHGVGKWRIILNDPEFSTTLKLRTNVDLKDKWRNLNQRKGGWRDGYKPQKDIDQKAIIPFNESAALTTTEARDKDRITQAEAVATVHKSWDDGDSNKLISRFDDGKLKRLTNAEQPSSSAQNQDKLPPPNLKVYTRRNKKTVTTDGELNKEKLPPPNLKLISERNKRMITSDGTLKEREMEYDATASAGSLQDGVCAEPIRARRMSSGEDSAAVAAALKKAKTATASGEEAEKEAVKVRKQKRRL